MKSSTKLVDLPEYARLQVHFFFLVAARYVNHKITSFCASGKFGFSFSLTSVFGFLEIFSSRFTEFQEIAAHASMFKKACEIPRTYFVETDETNEVLGRNYGNNL